MSDEDSYIDQASHVIGLSLSASEKAGISLISSAVQGDVGKSLH